MNNIETSLLDITDDFVVYSFDNENSEYSWCEVQFDNEEFNGKIYLYKTIEGWQEDEEIELTEEFNRELFNLLKETAIKDYN